MDVTPIRGIYRHSHFLKVMQRRISHIEVKRTLGQVLTATIED